MRNYTYILLLICSIFLIGCGNEKAKLVDKLSSIHDQKTNSISCHHLDFYTNVLSQSNVLQIFECIGWNSEYSELYEYISSIPEVEYELIIAPLNNELFGSIDIRNEFLSFIQKNLSSNSVSQYSDFLAALVDEYNILPALIKIISNDAFILPKQSLLRKSLVFLESFLKKTDSSRHNLYIEYNRQRVDNKKFNVAYDQFSNNLVNSVLSSKSNLGEKLVSFLTPNEWAINFVRRYDSSDFIELLNYSTYDTKLKENAAFLRSAMKLNLYNCYEFSATYVIDHKKELEARLDKLARSTKSEYLMDLFELSEQFSLFNNICPYKEFNQVTSELLGNLREFSLLPGGFSVLKSLAKVSQEQNNYYSIFDTISSDVFQSLLGIVKIEGSQGNKLLLSIYELLKDITPAKLSKLTDVLRVLAIEVDSKKYDELWNLLDSSEKNQVVHFAAKQILSGNKLDGIVLPTINFLNSYPDLYRKYSAVIKSNRSLITNIADRFNQNMQRESFRDELKSFFGKGTFFKLIDLITTEGGIKVSLVVDESPFKVEKNSLEYIEQESLVGCLEKFHRISMESYDFWFLLDNYPSQCLELVNNRTMGSYIFQWTIEIDKLFMEKFSSRFSLRYGMLSPGMMTFFHSIIHIVNESLDQKEEYISNVVFNIKEELFNKGLVEVLDTSTKLLANIDSQTDTVKDLLVLASTSDVKKFDATIKTVVKIFSQTISKKELEGFYSCSSVLNGIGGNPCFTKENLSVLLSDSVILLKRKNYRSPPLIDLLLEFVFSKKGIRIPFDSNRQRSKTLSLEEIVRFSFDITDERTIKDISYIVADKKIKLRANLAERLEVVIREISFLDNFYGAYFMNNISSAKKYSEKVKSFKKNVSLMDKTSSFFRKKGLYPPETAWAFKNILQTYDSLLEVNNSFKQKDGSTRRYGDLMQAALTMVVESSSKSSQRFSAFQTPKVYKVKRHNGILITNFTRLSLISHLGEWVRHKADGEIGNVLENKKFKAINKNLINLVSLNAAKRLADKFLNSKNIQSITEDMADFIFNLNSSDINSIERIVYNLAYFLSENLNARELDSLIPLINVIIENYHLLRENDLFSFDTRFVKEANEMLLKILTLDKEEQRLIANLITASLNVVKVEDFQRIIQNKESMGIASELKLSLLNYLGNPEHNTGFLSSFINDDLLNFYPLHKMLVDVFANDKELSYFRNIVGLLATKDDNKNINQSNLVAAMRELFERDDILLERFLTDMFDRFSIQR